MPSPGSLAEQALNDRHRKKGLPTMEEVATESGEKAADPANNDRTGKDRSRTDRPKASDGSHAAPAPVRRQQPKRNSRDKRRQRARDERERPQPTS